MEIVNRSAEFANMEWQINGWERASLHASGS